MAAHRARFTCAFAGVFICHALFVGGLLARASSKALIAKLECPDRVNGVAYSPDGQFLAAGYGWNDRGGVRIWNAKDRSVVQTFVTKKTENGPEGIEKLRFRRTANYSLPLPAQGTFCFGRSVFGEGRSELS